MSHERPRGRGAGAAANRPRIRASSGGAGIDLVVRVAAAALALTAVAVLWSQAAIGTFATDECFHAAASETLMRERRLPVTFPQFYSGFYYYYQPFFHVVGALWAAVGGTEALHVLPPALYAGLLALCLMSPFGRGSAIGGTWAALLCATQGSLAPYAVRLYAEGLVTLLVAAAAALTARFLQSPRRWTALALGVVSGCATLTKFSAWILPGAILVGALVAWRQRRGDVARGLVLAAGIAVAMVAPHLVRNQVLYGSAVYPAFAPDLDRALYALNHARFSTPLPAFYARLPNVFGLPVLAMAAAAIAVMFVRRSFGWKGAFLAFALLGALVVPLAPYASERHLNPYIALVALASAAIVSEALERRRLVRAGVSVVLLAAVALQLPSLQGQRSRFDLPPTQLQAFRAIAAHVPADGLILSLWTYDTAWYSGRRATWPNPWGQRTHPVEMFYETDPERFVAQLRRHGITHIILPIYYSDEPFNSANYPGSFFRCAGSLQIAWRSELFALLKVPE